MDLNSREERYYVRMAGKIERELGIKYEGNSYRQLVMFVKSHQDELKTSKPYTGKWTDRKKKKKSTRRSYTALKPAQTKPAGMFRKHGSGQKFQSENT